MLTVGDKFPEFSLKATVSENLDTAFETISNASYPGKWLVVFFWPKDFTFVCPTEIAEFGRQNGEFADRRSEEHTSELQSRENLVCRLLLEKKKRNTEVMQTT